MTSCYYKPRNWVWRAEGVMTLGVVTSFEIVPSDVKTRLDQLMMDVCSVNHLFLRHCCFMTMCYLLPCLWRSRGRNLLSTANKITCTQSLFRNFCSPVSSLFHKLALNLVDVRNCLSLSYFTPSELYFIDFLIELYWVNIKSNIFNA